MRHKSLAMKRLLPMGTPLQARFEKETEKLHEIVLANWRAPKFA